MKKILPLSVALVLASGMPLVAADMKDPAAVLSIMHKVADWQLANPSKHGLTDWTQGVGDAGFMALASLPDGGKYEEAMMDVGRKTGWNIGKWTYFADDYCVGQMYCELFLRHHDPAMIAPLRNAFDLIMAHPEGITKAFRNENIQWWWCDALFMGPAAWARLHAATGDKRYLDFMMKEWKATSDFLYDKQEHLYFRDKNYFGKQEKNGKKVFWARGNGWVLAGLPRMLQYLPKDYPGRDQVIEQFRQMSKRIASLQQPDGLWRSSLLDPDSYPSKETSSSALFCYGLAWGINSGLLDRATYLPVVEKAWNALVECVNPDGKLTHVQPIGADPRHFDPESTEVYGVGAFLLAGSEVYRLLKPESPAPAASKP